MGVLVLKHSMVTIAGRGEHGHVRETIDEQLRGLSLQESADGTDKPTETLQMRTARE
jgi:hypothetical protein